MVHVQRITNIHQSSVNKLGHIHEQNKNSTILINPIDHNHTSTSLPSLNSTDRVDDSGAKRTRLNGTFSGGFELNEK